MIPKPRNIYTVSSPIHYLRNTFGEKYNSAAPRRFTENVFVFFTVFSEPFYLYFTVNLLKPFKETWLLYRFLTVSLERCFADSYRRGSFRPAICRVGSIFVFRKGEKRLSNKKLYGWNHSPDEISRRKNIVLGVSREKQCFSSIFETRTAVEEYVLREEI